MRENDQILCNEELLRELREIEKVTMSETKGKEDSLGIWTYSTEGCLTIICC
ncbi:MAG: hypothetical protein KHX56_06595 [Clostridiales bacterium]|nr:hypothetical protein [Clostridiales bacterium]